MGIPIRTSLLTLLVAGFGVTAALADGETSLSTQFSSTTGWTSNAGGDSFEAASLFAQQSGTVTGMVRGTDYILRGSISGTQTQFLDTEYENDRSAAANVILDYQLTQDIALRGSLQLGVAETGSILDLGGFGFAMRTLNADVNADLTLAQSWDQLEVALDLSHTQQRIGASHVPDLPFAPERLDPDVLLYTAGLRVAYRLEGNVALLADAGWRYVDIPASDQVTFGRLPVTALRLAAGAQMGEAGTQLVAKGGADFLLASALPGVTQTLPYVEIEGSWTISDSFGLDAAASAQTYLGSPADGVADWTLAASAGAHWVPMDGLVVNSSAYTERDYLSDGQTWVQSRRGVRLGANQRMGDNVDIGINLSLSDTRFAGGDFQTSRLALDLNAVM